MIWDSLKNVMSNNSRQTNQLYVRNLLKEVMHFYILNYIYSDEDYRNLIFTGGTCLRRCFNLPRLSEDLDFNYEEKLDLDKFASGLEKHFKEDLQFSDLSIKKGPALRSLFLKFAVLQKLGYSKNRAESDILLVRLDFHPNESEFFKTETSTVSGEEFFFIARRYDLSTLFANKIIALLERVYKKGPQQTESFKGRDVFDLFWFLEQGIKTGLKPNYERLKDFGKLETKENLVNNILEKINKVEDKSLQTDLSSFFANPVSIANFCANYKDIIKNDIGKVIT